MQNYCLMTMGTNVSKITYCLNRMKMSEKKMSMAENHNSKAKKLKGKKEHKDAFLSS